MPCAMLFDAAREPVLNFRFHPPHSTQAYTHSSRKSAFGLELVNHGASKAGDLADLWESEDLYRSNCYGELNGHVGNLNVWFR